MPNTQTHTEKIKCPDCGTIQDATVEHTIPFHTYLHNCEKCNFTIMESDWEVVPNTEKQMTACQMLREKVKAKIDNTYDEQALNALWAIDDIIDDLLTTERQQLIGFGAGCIDKSKKSDLFETKNIAKQNYFNTFKTQ